MSQFNFNFFHELGHVLTFQSLLITQLLYVANQLMANLFTNSNDYNLTT